MEALFTTVGTFDVSSAMLLYLLWLSLLFFCRRRLARQRNRRLGYCISCAMLLQNSRFQLKSRGGWTLERLQAPSTWLESRIDRDGNISAREQTTRLAYLSPRNYHIAHSAGVSASILPFCSFRDRLAARLSPLHPDNRTTPPLFPCSCSALFFRPVIHATTTSNQPHAAKRNGEHSAPSSPSTRR